MFFLAVRYRGVDDVNIDIDRPAYLIVKVDAVADEQEAPPLRSTKSVPAAAHAATNGSRSGCKAQPS